ncbi:MAG: hypothetical protein COU07_03600 [Candidatus Harrisonbacteria bacterium CG10_big_fil_rev_8_21_14_0_10_40_38]|uniref:Uncharacterized protein n=1 Tax=Candidatus Harrisonbacteria bacterium CG10_big_fil_rev_8_21_14_0_10_40_38 TaxID=1974583 RepID=A0A2H0UR81_9BACT|nr:MAG: hypothetical protein COU07_03600 [Candidatus Harrisonbacteria bacterium CG10_big_fil_rev_8_21_14_0_10_40_38]
MNLNNFRKKIGLSFVYALFSVLFISGLVAYAYWVDPLSNSGNIRAPITTSSSGQLREGTLTVGAISVMGGANTGKVVLTNRGTNGLPSDGELGTARLYVEGDVRVDNLIIPNRDQGSDPSDHLHKQVLTLTDKDSDSWDPWHPSMAWEPQLAWLTIVSREKLPGNSCGDGVCTDPENAVTCPKDCSSQCPLPGTPGWDGNQFTCIQPYCGDSVCQRVAGYFEKPAGAPGPGNVCLNDCGTWSGDEFPPVYPGGFCGDGIVQSGGPRFEQCDPPGTSRWYTHPNGLDCLVGCSDICTAFSWCGVFPPPPLDGTPTPTPSLDPTPTQSPTITDCNDSDSALSCGERRCGRPSEVCVSVGSSCRCQGTGGGVERDAPSNLASFIDVAKAQTSCDNLALPQFCSDGWLEQGLYCDNGSNPAWVRVCYRPIE